MHIIRQSLSTMPAFHWYLLINYVHFLCNQIPPTVYCNWMFFSIMRDRCMHGYFIEQFWGPSSLGWNSSLTSYPNCTSHLWISSPMRPMQGTVKRQSLAQRCTGAFPHPRHAMWHNDATKWREHVGSCSGHGPLKWHVPLAPWLGKWREHTGQPGWFCSSWPWMHLGSHRVPLAPQLRKWRERAGVCRGVRDTRRGGLAKKHTMFSLLLHPLCPHLFVASFICFWLGLRARMENTIPALWQSRVAT